ncbi:hypothetical protein P171DRAFT_519361 [Karstenula rhodostoma CBS 690.94]|uniref:Uncharacterized protein n=1 Tax=Karstenula rhodostoma CBS 690.94 TaxID=1392251 RepID=A0A9P4PL10_9PLEO|nr:hypothetical protein P171DRAFT_519361 [Karstenula rhodostoma CBS 690.94]
MAEPRQLQGRDGRPSAIDQWNKSIAIPVPVRHVNTTRAAVQKAKPSTPTPAKAVAKSSSSSKTTTRTALSAAQTITAATLNFALGHPNFMKRYAFPLALNTLSKPLLALFPLGPLGPILAFVAVACGRFKLRQEFMGGGYALLHAVRMAGVKGQALSLLGLVGLEATGSKRLRDTFVSSLMESNVGLRAQVVGLAIAVLSSATGTFGSLGSMLGARAMSLLFKELRSFATFHGLRWAATNLQGLWLTFCASSDVLKASFLSYVLRRGDDAGKLGAEAEADDDTKRMQWARRTLELVAARIPLFPVEAVAPELAVILKAWEMEKETNGAGAEAIDEWIEIDANDESSIWSDVSHKKREDMAASTADRPTLEDFGHRRSRAENAEFLEQVARETFVKSGMSEEDVVAALDKTGFGARRMEPWTMEVEELDSDLEDDDGIEVIDLGDI